MLKEYNKFEQNFNQAIETNQFSSLESNKMFLYTLYPDNLKDKNYIKSNAKFYQTKELYMKVQFKNKAEKHLVAYSLYSIKRKQIKQYKELLLKA